MLVVKLVVKLVVMVAVLIVKPTVKLVALILKLLDLVIFLCLLAEKQKSESKICVGECLEEMVVS